MEVYEDERSWMCVAFAPESRLIVADKRGIECKNTPAKAAGITDSKWTLRNLLTFKCFKTPII